MENTTERLHPRLAAKLQDLQKRGMLTSAKAYTAPQDMITKKEDTQQQPKK
jgi:hypothetical protein